MACFALGPYSVRSDFPLEGLIAIGDGAPDPDIDVQARTRAPVDHAWETIYHTGERDRAGSVGLWRAPGADEFCLRFDFREHYADFFLSADGRRVAVSTSGEIPPEHLAALIEGPVLGRALRLAGRPALHATVLGWQGLAIGVMGPSGAGKSTLAAILTANGCTLLNDDLALLDFSTAGMRTHAARPRLRLWPTNAAALPIDLAAATPILEGVGNTPKLAVPVSGAVRGELVPVAALFQLQPRAPDAGDAEAEPLAGPAAVAAVAANLYGSIPTTAALRRAELRLAAEITGRVAVNWLRLPDTIEYLRTHGADLRDRLFG